MLLIAQANADKLSFGMAYLWLVLGVILSVVIPVAARTLRPAPADTHLRGLTWRQRLLELLIGYGKIGAAAAAIALLFALVFDFDSSRLAFLAGYAWDSTLQKVTRP